MDDNFSEVEQYEFKGFKPEELVCAKCSSLGVSAGTTKCDTHGTDFIDFKCRFCCSIAVWFCVGTTHYCDPCYRARRGPKPCKGEGLCDLKLDKMHPVNGTEFALGCSMCRSQVVAEKYF